ncbi:MAG: hypothetical protein H6515_14820 [Microthrixaceae bacterium]|nr:hypothetical protein [Microthrixaceae bacterium]
MRYDENVDALAAAIAAAFRDIGRPIALGVRDRVAERLINSGWYQHVVDEAETRGRHEGTLHEECHTRIRDLKVAVTALARELEP